VTKREAFLTNPDCYVTAAGEEEVLASYLWVIVNNEHEFLQPGEGVGFPGVHLPEGGWMRYVTSGRREAKFAADEISYKVWDD
jgi:hypothetical protein